jgi:hypothetical protein
MANNSLKTDYYKIVAVIRSCETLSQLEIAKKMLWLFQEKHARYSCTGRAWELLYELCNCIKLKREELTNG